MPTEPHLSFRNLSVAYGPSSVVKDVSFTVQRGEVAAVVGESGSGKTQTALAILRLLPAQATPSGAIVFEGEDLLALSARRLDAIRGRRIAFIFQEPMSALDPLFSVGAQIGAILRLRMGLSQSAAAKRAEELLDLVGIPEPARRLRAYPHELSGGQRQRVAIAMAISCGPDLLIADEPTTALDVTVAARILELLMDLKRRLGMALIFISHDLSLVRRFADSVQVMRNGEIVESGPAAEILSAPKQEYTRLLLAAVPEPRQARPVGDAPIVLSARDISMAYRLRGGWLAGKLEIKAVDGVSLTLRKGRTLGIAGESGSGKSTLGRALLKLIPAQGAIIFEGRNLTALDRAEMRPLRRFMQLVFQDPYGSLSPRMRIGDVVSEGLRVHEPALTQEERDRRAARALEEVSLDPDLRRRFPHELSGGQRQRVAIARAMILKPRLVVLDEPTSALDRSVQIEILALLRNLQDAHGLAYIFISHDLAVLRALADEIAVMKDGRIVEQGEARQILEAPRDAYARALVAAAFGGDEV
ncbi:ABC transporter ATP-binding protein [Methylocapsa acidiphila]|uniref:ABC transporter ATP-binding protein n=1 Tax=Methylocapsa acidiphila TaxID=133552 RepID=UPI00042187F6|nr:dipeptide ABC transporter ATP-binding protein [Methylocapsa acidiphila]